MAKLNLTQAAKAAGIARGTLYRHIEDGKVSCEKNDNGERVIDTSELLRVYKRLHNDETSKGDVSNAESEQHGTPHDVQLMQQENEHLKQRLVEVEKDKLERKEREEKLQADNTRLLGIIEKQTLLLNPPEQPKKGKFLGLFGQ